MKNDDSSSMSLIEKAAARQARARLEAAEAATLEEVPADAPLEACSSIVPEEEMMTAGVAPQAEPESVDAPYTDGARQDGARVSDFAGAAGIAAVGGQARGVASIGAPNALVSVPKTDVPAPAADLSIVRPPPVDLNFQILETEGFLTPGEGRSQLAQEMRRIKRPLLMNMRRDGAQAAGYTQPTNLMMVSSALPNEGKTYISINLAMSIAAEMNRKVLLVDGDVAKGHVSRTLGFAPDYGLSQILNSADLSEHGAIYDTNVPGLSLLGAGENDLHMDELFASERMGQLVRRLALSDPDRIVIFDAPPLLATTEASVLARLMGQIILVVEADKTPQGALREALNIVDDCDFVSLLLNKVVTGGLGGAYGYGYGYGYGYNYGSNPEESAAAS